MFTLCYFLPETLSESGILYETTLIRDNTKILFVNMIYKSISVEQKLALYKLFNFTLSLLQLWKSNVVKSIFKIGQLIDQQKFI